VNFVVFLLGIVACMCHSWRTSAGESWTGRRLKVSAIRPWLQNTNRSFFGCLAVLV